MKFKTGIGQDSHRFLPEGEEKKCTIAGLEFEGVPGLDADSDGDVVFHSLCNAITSLTHLPILGGVAIELCKRDGVTDSRLYLDRALQSLGDQMVEHVAFTIEGSRPKFQHRADEIRQSVASALSLSIDQVGITFTSGDGLTAFGRGEGLQCFCLLTTSTHS
ncbi:MAG: 2-C-methyl-D-erythritol 2,4-cyclodiphosphate synthase [Chlamydiae bacterium]|nr:2-C-methyl-D-erythritol 2,4-cyclodiphosphate synthase [Chlamydiota bacterium]